jgi:hypothetical protein
VKIKILSVTFTIVTCLTWLINGLFCKILNLVPRHESIVAKILGIEYAHGLTILIGISEVLMVIWILSRIKPRFCAVFQILIVMTMNVVEFVVASDLLLFGKGNIIFASLFSLIIYINEFLLKNPKLEYAINQ